MAGQSVSPSPSSPSKLQTGFCTCLPHTSTGMPEKHLIPSMSKEQLIISAPVYTHLSTLWPNEWYLSSFTPVQFSYPHCLPPGIPLWISDLEMPHICFLFFVSTNTVLVLTPSHRLPPSWSFCAWFLPFTWGHHSWLLTWQIWWW